MATAIVWFRRDLRLADQPALSAAIRAGYQIVPLYVHAPDEEAPWQPGGASRWWLHHSLTALAADLRTRGSKLILRSGPSLSALEQVIDATGAEAVYWNRLYEPAVIERDERIKRVLRQRGLHVESHNASLLIEPWNVQTGQGDPYKVFTPFWKNASARLGTSLQAWQTGKTGIPIVDAGMRELWHIGWMHNRVRMVVASLLTKNLRQHWLHGARWFWDTLVDADLANNTQGWQWSAGSGADAAPYFRIFNPVSQGERFDPDGDYVSTWIPELASLPAKWRHQPWAAPASVLDAAGLARKSPYRQPRIDLKHSREQALAAYATIKAPARD